MLGVLKRRLKPKRPGEKENNHNSRKNVHAKSEAIVPVDMARITSSQRQIHPLFEEKAQLLAYDDSISGNKPTPTPNVKRSPDDPPPKKSAAVPELIPPPSIHPSIPGSPAAIYHPAPNICVEGGRIEFIKSPSEGSKLHASTDPQDNNPDKKASRGALYQSSEQNQRKSVVATTRAQQTQADIGDFVEADEKCDIAKEFLEARIKELERLLEAEQKSGQRERLAVARLQRQLARREVIHRDVDRERRLRADTESRLRETVVESERYRTTLAGLQREFSRMEDTVRTMLQYKSRCEILNQEKASLTAAYENRAQQYQNTISKLNQENESLRHQIRLLETTGTAEIQSTLLERLRTLESENAHITRDADFQRKQYEKCLDDIANQVVRALLSQKGLREEIGNLQRRIKELENQNHALANILVRKFENGESGLSSGKNALINKSWFPGSYGERIRCEGSTVSSVTSSSVLPDLEDKSVLKNVLQTPLRSLETLLLPLQRPRSLNLFLHASRIPASSINSIFSSQHGQHRKSKLNLVHLSKKQTEDEGNESPESGNKDEGYSTMSSDVQCPGDANELSKRELEDLKEATDETEVVKLDAGNSFASVVLVEDVSDPDIFFIPLNFTLTINPRHSYPPTKDFLPFQHIMKSFSDSHLCLKLDPNNPLLTSPISPSMLFVDLIEKNHPLRRSKATNSLLSKEEEILQETEETQSSAGSWCSGTAEGCWWDTEYIQHYLKLDDVRFKSFHPQKDFFHFDYDNTELEDWSLSLSCEDISKYADMESRKGDTSSPGMLPSIQECNGYELESDSNSKVTGKLSYLTVDTRELEPAVWPYKEKESLEMTSWNSAQSMESPGGSWSSVTSNNSDYSCHSLNEGYHNECAKRCSTASDDAESSAVGTDFTRDFYRLVKFESTKSLASNSSRSLTNGDVNIKESFGQSNVRESALKNVLNFIAEQQQYCHEREEEDTILQSYSKSPEKSEETNGFKSECHGDQTMPDGNVYCGDEQCVVKSQPNKTNASCDGECPSSEGNFRSAETAEEEKSHRNCIAPAAQQTVKWDADKESAEVMDNSANRTEIYNKCTALSHYEVHDSVSNYGAATSHLMTISEEGNENGESVCREEPREEDRSPRRQESLIPVLRPMQDSTSAKMPQRRKMQQTTAKLWGTKIPVISTRKSEPSTSMPKITERKTVSHRETNIPVPTARKGELQKSSNKKVKASPEVSKVVMAEDGSFHERATSKDVIDELNRMIRKGEEIIPGNSEGDMKPLDIACCCPTGWVHVESDIDFTDPKARANLLDVMLASSGSSGGSGSSSDSGGDDPVDYSHLHRLHRFRRQRKACATRKQLGVLRYPLTSVRPSIIGRENFFFRYGDKEREAIASFDFLEDFSTTSASGCSSTDTLGWSQAKYQNSSPHSEPELPSPEVDVVTIATPTTPATPSDDSDERTGGPVSLSDSCADSYTESTESVEDQC